jgi:hypothetical protein
MHCLPLDGWPKTEDPEFYRGGFRSSCCRHGLADTLRLCAGNCGADRACPRGCGQRRHVRRAAGEAGRPPYHCDRWLHRLWHVRGLGAERVVDYRKERFEDSVSGVDVVVDTVGGETQERSFQVLKPGGILVSVVSRVLEAAQKRYGVRAAYFYVDVTTDRLNKIAELFDRGKLVTDVGSVLPLEEARLAHEVLDGAPHKPGKIVLTIAA